MAEARPLPFVVPPSYVNCIGSMGSQECAHMPHCYSIHKHCSTSILCTPGTLGLDWMMSSVSQGNGGLVAYVSISPQKWEDVCS